MNLQISGANGLCGYESEEENTEQTKLNETDGITGFFVCSVDFRLFRILS
jgi:hypothetical protein